MDAAMLTGGVIMLCPLVPDKWGGWHPSLSIRPWRCGSFSLCLANETFPPDCSPVITRGALVPVKGRRQRLHENNGTQLPAVTAVHCPTNLISHVWKEFRVGGNKNVVF